MLAALLASMVALRALDEQVTRPLRGVGNVLEGLRRGERGLRVAALRGSAVLEVHTELNRLAEAIHTLREGTQKTP